MTLQCMTSSHDLPASACMHYPRFLNEFNCSSSSKLLYCMLLDATLREGQSDENGQLYVYLSIPKLNRMILRGESTTKRLLHELAENGLLMRRRKQGGKPSKIYVCVPERVTPIAAEAAFQYQIC